jgi:hypothetical protein
MYDDASLDDYWAVLRPEPQRRTPEPMPSPVISLETATEWAKTLGSPGHTPLMVVPGTPMERCLTFRAVARIGGITHFECDPENDAWLEVGLDTTIAALVSCQDLDLEGTIRTMADTTHYLEHDVFRLLWEIRFLRRENSVQAEELFDIFRRWIRDAHLREHEVQRLRALGVSKFRTSFREKVEVLCFLRTLASQNEIQSSLVLAFNGLDQAIQAENKDALRQLVSLASEVRRWALITHCPIGILLGFSTTRSDTAKLRKLNQNLTAELEAGLAWSKS